jgi:Glycosyl hydrolase 108
MVNQAPQAGSVALQQQALYMAQQQANTSSSLTQGQPLTPVSTLPSAPIAFPTANATSPATATTPALNLNQMLLSMMAIVLQAMQILVKSNGQQGNAAASAVQPVAGNGLATVPPPTSVSPPALGTSWMAAKSANPGTLPMGGYQQAKTLQQANPSGGSMNSEAAYKKALDFVLKWEGGYSNVAADTGGATMKGITFRNYNAYRQSKGLPTQDVRKISEAEIQEIYRKKYWEGSGADKIANTNPALAMAIFNCAVNMGPGRAKELLPQANGSATKLVELMEAKYRQFASKKGQEVFLKGWLNRNNEAMTLAKSMEASGGGQTA